MGRALPDWIGGYLKYTEDQESPESYHFWTGMSILSAAVRRQVAIERVKYHLYPNLYILLIADSARTRKSVPLAIGLSLLQEAIPDIVVLTDSATPEGIIKYMNRPVSGKDEKGRQFIATESHLMIVADELASLFGYDKARASRLTILLTRAYSCPSEYRHTTVKDSMVQLNNLYLTFIAATAPANLKVIPDEAVGGLLGRLLIVSEKNRRRSIAWGDNGNRADDAILREKLTADLFRIGSLRGEFRPTQDAKDFFEEWYLKQASVVHNDPNVDAFHERCHDTAIKIACLLSISRGDDLIVTAQHMAAGIAIIEKQLPEFSRVVQWAGATVYSQNRAKVVDLLRRGGGVATRRSLIRFLGIPVDELDLLLKGLQEEETVQIKRIGTSGKAEVLYELKLDAMGAVD